MLAAQPCDLPLPRDPRVNDTGILHLYEYMRTLKGTRTISVPGVALPAIGSWYSQNLPVFGRRVDSWTPDLDLSD